MRQFAVLGLGAYGYHMALELARHKCEVLVIDWNEADVTRIKDKVAHAVVADVTDRETLTQLGVQKVDCALVNLGSRMDYSILTTLHLKEMGVPEIVVKAVSDEHERILQRIGATRVVLPEREAGIRIARSLVNTNVLDYIPLPGEFSIVDLKPGEKYVGHTIAESNLRGDYNLNILAVAAPKGENDTQIIFPVPGYKIKTDDRLMVLGHNDDIARFQQQ